MSVAVGSEADRQIIQLLEGISAAGGGGGGGGQPLDSDLTAIAALTPANDDIIQRKSSAWTNRTLAQLKTDLSLQPLDQDLTDVAALTPSNDDILQRKAGAWANRTLAQIRTDLGLQKTVTGVFDGQGVALVAANTGVPFTVKYAGTIVGYSISADTGTCTIKVWKRAAGTAIPTIANVINTSGVGLASGTSTGIVTTPLTDFTTLAVASGDMITFALTAVASATKVIVTLYINL